MIQVNKGHIQISEIEVPPPQPQHTAPTFVI